MRPAAIVAYTAAMGTVGNASSLHTAGRDARRSVEEARESLAKDLGARPSEVIFTGGGTEADNLAIKGTFLARHAQDPKRRVIAISAVEHHAVLDPAQWLVDAYDAELVILPVDAEGRLSLEALAKLLEERADEIALVSIMWANNEIGTLEPIRRVVDLTAPHGIPVHSDAVQAFGSVPVDFSASGLTLMTVSAHKLGGPYGVGALVAQRSAALVPVLHGGGQERGLRSGTLDVPGIVSFAVAAREACDELRDGSGERIAALRDRLIKGVTALDGVTLRGPDPTNDDAGSENRLPGNAFFTVRGCEGDSLLYLLDAKGVQCSTGSACRAGVPQISHVLLALGLDDAEARGALRLTLGHGSTDADVDAVLEALPAVIERARAAGMAAS